MSTFQTHKKLYLRFKEDAFKCDLYAGTRVEAYFLSRPKFAYSIGWKQEDFKDVELEYIRIERIALEKLENA